MMDSSKFTDFSIDCILGQNIQGFSQKNAAISSSELRQESSPYSLSHRDGFGGKALYHPTHQMGICTNGINGYFYYGHVHYRQTFNSLYFARQPWIIQESESTRLDSCASPPVQPKQRSRVRTVFTERQNQQLDRLFNVTDYPSVEARAELAKATGLSEETVRVWFKNRRARQRRQKSAKRRPSGSLRLAKSAPMFLERRVKSDNPVGFQI